MRDLCKETNYFSDPSSPANLKQVEQIDTLIEFLSLENLKTLNEKLKEEDVDQRAIVLAEVKRMEDEVAEKARIELAEQQAASASSSSTGATNQSKIKWTTEEIELLVKALRVYPAGVQNRWVVIQEYLKRSGANPNLTAQEIMFKAKDVASGKREVEATTNALENVALNAHKHANNQEVQAKLSSLTVTEREPEYSTTTPWTADEQKIFEQALRTYPASLGASRWDQITTCLPGRNKRDCLERYKELARIVQAKKSTSTKTS